VHVIAHAEGDAVLEANSIELQREGRAMVASGSVKGVLPGVAARESASGAPGKSKSTLWHIAADNLIYREAENKAHLENNVAVQSADSRHVLKLR